MKPIFFILGLCSFLLSAACAQQVPNPIDCTNDESICTQSGLVCDTSIHQCVMVDGCITTAMCSAPNASYCSNHRCSACTEDAQCSEWTSLRGATPQRNYCAPINQQNNCVECRQGMADVDCPDPNNSVCDASLGLCRPCRSDKDCPSRICRKLGDSPDIPPVAGLMIGQCVPSAAIAYVDQDSDSCVASGTTSSPDKPFCALTTAIGMNTPYISIAGSRNYYADINIDLPGRTLIINGPTGDTRAYVYLSNVKLNNGTLVLVNATVVPRNAAASAVICNGSGSSLYLVNSTLINLSMKAVRYIDASMDCGQLTVDRVSMNCNNQPKYGIAVGGVGTVTTNYRIVNSNFALCGTSGGEFYAVQINNMASGYFGFNTMTGNYKGVFCANPSQTVVNSVVAGNTASQIDGCTFDPAYNVTDENLVEFGTPPFLQTTSPKNFAAVVDKGLPPPADQPVMIDFDANLRPMGNGYDIGFQELK